MGRVTVLWGELGGRVVTMAGMLGIVKGDMAALGIVGVPLIC